MPPTVRRVADAAVEIIGTQPDFVDFLHVILCQVGMPRRRVDGRVFERRNGAASLLLEAGKLYRRGQWVDAPLPYGTRPRLVMVHLSSEAVRTKSRTIEVGDSIYEFLKRLGIDTSGGAKGGYTMFKKQMEALAACRLSLGLSLPDRDITINTQPISHFEAWLVDGPGRALWPGVMELSQEFFDTLVNHAVPLDPRALASLKHSALALDVYSWLAHRLCRITQDKGIVLNWLNLKEQFGQEYADIRSFRREFKEALVQVHAVYSDAKIEALESGSGYLLKPSPPPIPKIQVVNVGVPGKGVDKPGG
ncbi:MAG: replication protein [Magnetococcales bacterium]|nr:replication protein [Magnetococcales bacterium]